MTRFHLTSLIAAVLVAAACMLFSDGALIAALLCVAALYLVVFVVGVCCIRLQFFCDAFCCGGNEEQCAALTFDDGPDPEVTPALLDTLAKRNVLATFFLVGRKVAAHPEVARRIVEAGHMVGNHTYRHAWWTNFMTGRPLRREIDRAQDAIGDATGVTPWIYRPPMGLTNPHVRSVLSKSALRMIGWHVRAFDTLPHKVPQLIRRVVRKVRHGSVIVLHDGGADPAALTETVDAIIVALKEKGYHFVRIDHMCPQPSTDH